MDQQQSGQQNDEQNKLLKQQDWDRHNKKAEKAARAYQDFMATDTAAARPQKKSGKRWLFAVLGILLLLVIGGVIFKFVLSDKEAGDKTAVQKETTKEQTSSPIASTETEDFTSAELGLAFKYPNDWKLDDKTPGKLTVTSPKVSLSGKDGTKASGKITLTIRAKGQPLPEFEKGNATAVKQSELLKYKTPSPNQRANTYLTFVAHAPAVSGLDALYITGDYGYQKGQAVPQVDIANVDPVISVAFSQCSDDNCSKVTPLSISESSWDAKTFSDPIKNMLQSITVQ
jgi:hypothetical protein